MHYHHSDNLQAPTVMCFQAKGFTVTLLILCVSSTLSFLFSETHWDSKVQEKYTPAVVDVIHFLYCVVSPL